MLFAFQLCVYVVIAIASYVTEACIRSYLQNSWLTEFAHHEASVGYHKTVIIVGAKQVTITLRGAACKMIDLNYGRGYLL